MSESSRTTDEMTAIHREAHERKVDWRVILDEHRAAHIPKAEQCGRCDGTGNELMFMYRACAACGGDGRSRGNEDQFDD